MNGRILQRLRYAAAATLLVAALALVNLTQTACNRDDTDPPAPTAGPVLKDKLSDYQFFTGDIANLEPAATVTPYDLAVPLFTDYALKKRYVYLPPGTQMTYKADGTFDFPDGAVLIKVFYYDNDFRDPTKGRRILETRLLVKAENTWQAATYLWNDTQTEAYLNKAGDVLSVQWTHTDGSARSINYIVPSKNDCKGCHEVALKVMPIGPQAKHLNRAHQYPTGTVNQLTYFSQLGLLAGAPDPATLTRLPLWDVPTDGTLEQRARAYLDINCAHCHNPQGPANNAGLDLRYSNTNPYTLGFCKTPVAAGIGTGGRLHDIVPGNPDASILIYRYASTTPGVSMPELGRGQVHTEGLQLLRDWIASLPPDNCQ